MSYTAKIDVLELLINVLKEHEKKLDELVGRLEATTPRQGSLSEQDLMRRFYE